MQTTRSTGGFDFLGFIGLLGNFSIAVFFVNSAYAVLYFYAYLLFGSIGRFYCNGIVGFEILLCHPFRIGCFSVIESVCIGFQTARYLSFYGNGLSEFGSCGNGDIEGNRHSYFDCKVFLYNCACFILCLYAYVIIGCFCGLDDCGIFGTEILFCSPYCLSLLLVEESVCIRACTAFCIACCGNGMTENYKR